MQGSPKFSGAPQVRKFGTGEEKPAYNGPGYFRTFVNGALLAAGWMTVLGLINIVKNRRDSVGDAPGSLEIEE